MQRAYCSVQLYAIAAGRVRHRCTLLLPTRSRWVYPDARKKRDHTYSLSTFNTGVPEGKFIGLNKCWHMPSLSVFRKPDCLNKSLADRGMLLTNVFLPGAPLPWASCQVQAHAGVWTSSCLQLARQRT